MYLWIILASVREYTIASLYVPDFIAVCHVQATYPCRVEKSKATYNILPRTQNEEFLYWEYSLVIMFNAQKTEDWSNIALFLLCYPGEKKSPCTEHCFLQLSVTQNLHSSLVSRAGFTDSTVGLSLNPREIHCKGAQKVPSPTPNQSRVSEIRADQPVRAASCQVQGWSPWSCPGSWADACLLHSHQAAPPWHRIMQG